MFTAPCLLYTCKLQTHETSGGGHQASLVTQCSAVSAAFTCSACKHFSLNSATSTNMIVNCFLKKMWGFVTTYRPYSLWRDCTPLWRRTDTVQAARVLIPKCSPWEAVTTLPPPATHAALWHRPTPTHPSLSFSLLPSPPTSGVSSLSLVMIMALGN